MDRFGLFLRRAAAYGVDYLAIALYAVLLAAVTITVAPGAELSKVQAYALSAATLTGPVILVFALLEARFGASLGKAVLGLRVRSHVGPVGFGRALVRNIGKFLPWEIAHIGIWTIPGQPFVDPPTPFNTTLWAVSGILVVVQIILILGTKAGFHDWMAGLRVERRRASPAGGGTSGQ